MDRKEQETRATANTVKLSQKFILALLPKMRKNRNRHNRIELIVAIRQRWMDGCLPDINIGQVLIHPLNMPPGSIRSILSLMIAGLFVLLLVLDLMLDVVLDLDLVMDLMNILVLDVVLDMGFVIDLVIDLVKTLKK